MSEDFLQSAQVLAATKSVNDFLRDHLRGRSAEIAGLSPQLVQAMEYSLFSGGKRFRPILCLMVNPQAVAYAAAIEMIHTYSLIHDDLPCMDNDDERRGQPTNHKKFGESLALLAGDALLTESFLVVAQNYSHRPEVATQLVSILSRAAGPSGMVGGQAMDMNLGVPLDAVAAVEKVHDTKTAELIAASLEGAGVVDGVSLEIRTTLRQVGLLLGLCFQLKDDLLDGEQDQSPKSILHFLSPHEAAELLARHSQAGHTCLSRLPQSYQHLQILFDYNQTRNH